MDSVTIRNIPEEMNPALNEPNTLNDNCEEDELGRMLAEAKQSPSTANFVEMLAAFGRKYGPIELLPRDQSPGRTS